MNREAELFPMAADAAATSGDAPTRRGLANGTYTLVNRAKGTHRTLRIRTQKDNAKFAPGKRVLSLLEGPDNESDYRGFAFVTDEGIARLEEAPGERQAVLARRSRRARRREARPRYGRAHRLRPRPLPLRRRS